MLVAYINELMVYWYVSTHIGKTRQGKLNGGMEKTKGRVNGLEIGEIGYVLSKTAKFTHW
jgi:hypothetical protein